MKDRIQQIMDHKKMTAAQFADKVGIQRSTLSHILNGRNNVSTEIVSKIHYTFPDLNINWLMFGEGDLNQSLPNRNQTLFDVFTPDLSAGESNKTKSSEEDAEKFNAKSPKSAETEITRQTEFPAIKQQRSIIKIMVFYSDNTFDTFSPDDIKY